MTQIITSFFLVLSLISCSKSGGEGKVESPIIQQASVSAVVGQAAPIILDLGAIPFGKSADGLISIKQSLVSNLIPSGLVDGKLVVSSDDEISIVSQSGCTSIKKSTGTCNIKVRANTQGLPEGTNISGSILFHSENDVDTIIQISAVVGNEPVVESPALVSSTSSGAFGSLSISDSPKDIILTYKALSLISSSDEHEVVVPSPFVIQAASADRCSNKTISKGASCTVKIRLDPKQVSTNGLVSGNITFAGLSIPVSATITGNPDIAQPEESQLVWIYNGSEISDLDLGTLLTSNVPVKFNLYLKNKSASSETVNVSVSGTGFTIINRCIEKNLLPQAQCSLEIRPENTVGTKTVALTVEDQPSLSLPLAVNIINQVITYQTVDTTPACLSLNLQICGGTQNISKSYICEQYIDGIKNESYVSNSSDCAPLADMNPVSCQSPAGQISSPISNGTQTLSCLQGSNVQTFVSVACNSNYHPVGEICEEDVVTYTPTYSAYGTCSINEEVACSGTGVKNRTITSCQKILNGEPVVGGQISDCSAYNIPSNTEISCQSPEGTINVTISGGSKVMYCSAGSSVQVTQSVSCSGEYVEKNGACVIPQEVVNSFSGFSGKIQKSIPLNDGSVIYLGLFTSFIDKNGTSYTANRIIKINADGTVNQEFQNNIGTGFDSSVTEAVIDSTNSNIYVIGEFTSLNGVSQGKFAKISITGVSDATFKANIGTACISNCIPTYIDRDSNNNIYLSGDFQYFNGTYVLSPSTNYAPVMKFSPAGIRDTSFQTTVGNVPESQTVAARLFVNKNNNHLIFTYCSSAGVCGLLKFSTTGTRDNTFQTNVGTYNGLGGIMRMVFDSSNNIYLMGSITVGKSGSTVRYLVKYSVTGIPDTAFNNAMVALNMNSAPRTLAFDGTYLYMSGGFFSVSGGTAMRLIRIDTSGVWDSAFNETTGTNETSSKFLPYAEDISFDNSGNIYLVGEFNWFNFKPANSQVKLNSSGEIVNFIASSPELNGTILQIKQDSAGNFYAVGNFSCYGKPSCSGSPGIKLAGIIKFNPDLSLNKEFIKNMDLTTSSAISGQVYSIAIDSNDNLYVGGSFTQFGLVSNNARGLAKISSNGVFNTAFSDVMDVNSGTKATNSGFNGSVNSIAIDSSNNLYVGGNFTQFKNILNNARYLAKLSSSGVFNTEFSDAMDVSPGTKSSTNSGFNAAINYLTLDGTGNLYAGGSFTSYKGVANSAKYLAKLSTGGVLDSAFQSNYGNTSTSGLNGAVGAIAVDSTGSVFVGGSFANYGSVTGSAKYLAKFDNNGFIDSTFMNKLDVNPGVKSASTSGFNSSVLGLLIDDNDLYVVGSFSSFKGVVNSAPRIAKMDLEGNLDESFQSNIGTGFNNSVNSILFGQDYRLYLGGYFTTYKGATKKYLMTLDTNGDN